MPTDVAVFAIEGYDGALGLAVVGDVDEIIDHDGRLAEAVSFLERTDVAVPNFVAVVSECRKDDVAVLEPQQIDVLGIDGGCAGRVTVEAVQVVGAGFKTFFPERRAGSRVECIYNLGASFRV